MIPLLKTSRLQLRAFGKADEQDLLTLISEKEVAATTLRIPHPCTLHDVQAWLSTHQEEYQHGKTIRWAITHGQEGYLTGGISLFLNQAFQSAELGYWIGKPYWGRGYAFEAASRVVEFGFNQAGLNRIEAHYMDENQASARILQKLGMQYEGRHRQLIKKGEAFRDVYTYAILRSDRFAVPAR
jgi:RimJ/RimL family protein N-acetyltransferase